MKNEPFATSDPSSKVAKLTESDNLKSEKKASGQKRHKSFSSASLWNLRKYGSAHGDFYKPKAWY